MWKKEDGPEAPSAPRLQSPAPSERNAPPRGSDERATIGRSITINGEVRGDEDLLIQGRVDGSVTLGQHAVTVGPEGVVKADITARVVTVEGSVTGNLRAEEQVILRTSALVEGDIAAPRVILEDGARFRGGVDMGESLVQSGRSAGAHTSRSTRETGSGTSGTPSATTEADEARSAATDAKGGGSHTAALVSR